MRLETLNGFSAMNSGIDMEIANAGQIGGDHYKSTYQHWDLVVNCDLGYLEGQVTKYVSRWKKKNGVQDLEKALHFAMKMHEVMDVVKRPTVPVINRLEESRKFIEVNGYSGFDALIIRVFASWNNISDVEIGKELIANYIEHIKNPPVADYMSPRILGGGGGAVTQGFGGGGAAPR